MCQVNFYTIITLFALPINTLSTENLDKKLVLPNSSLVKRETSSCENIFVPHCRNVGYNQTDISLSPFKFYTQDESGIELSQFYDLLTAGCHKNAKKTMTLLVCSLYTPTCIKGYNKFVPPCRELCEKSRSGCIDSMHQNGIEWPEAFDCSRFPSINDNDAVCLPEPNDKKQFYRPEQPKPDISKKKQVVLFEETEISLNMQDSEPMRNEIIDEFESDNCQKVIDEQATGRFSTKRYLMQKVIVICQGSSILFTLIFTLTFISRRKLISEDLQWPIWIIPCITLSHLIVNINSIINSIPSVNRYSCDLKQSNYFADQALSMRLDARSTHSTCFLSATIDYFFSMASASYYLVFAFSVFLTTLTESKHSELFITSPMKTHFMALIFPFLQTCIVLINKFITAKDTFPVMCKVQKNQIFTWILPLSCYYVLGFILLLVAICKFWRIQGITTTAICSSFASSNGYNTNSTNGELEQNPLMHQNQNLPFKSGPNLSFSQRKFAEVYVGCILRFSMYLIGYLVFSSMHLFCIATQNVAIESKNEDLLIFTSLLDGICILLIVLLQGIWLCKSKQMTQSHGNEDSFNKFSQASFQPVYVPGIANFNQPIVQTISHNNQLFSPSHMSSKSFVQNYSGMTPGYQREVVYVRPNEVLQCSGSQMISQHSMAQEETQYSMEASQAIQAMQMMNGSSSGDPDSRFVHSGMI